MEHKEPVHWGCEGEYKLGKASAWEEEFFRWASFDTTFAKRGLYPGLFVNYSWG